MYKEIFLLLVFILFSAADIIFIKKSNKTGQWLTKPFLMPVLAVFYAVSVPAARLNWLIIFALLFAFLGDCLLLNAGEMFLTAGLFSFLACHVLYIYVFAKSIIFSRIPVQFYVLLLPYVLYGAVIYIMLYPYLKSMKVQVFIYIGVISAMSFLGLMRMNNIYGYSFWMPFLGSFMFIFSDTMIAFNIFKANIKWREIMVMVTYIAAQLMIVLGFI